MRALCVLGAVNALDCSALGHELQTLAARKALAVQSGVGFYRGALQIGASSNSTNAAVPTFSKRTENRVTIGAHATQLPPPPRLGHRLD